ncbi:helix-turn-helix domain-containing protein [Neobacillus sp. D3-1R]|uniref:helix-turn-helix domain-containing protein n=1 Tax=Neobacillus sp. D3-1R TaxID=3445778 RepID=UPI003F9F60FF
MSNFLGEELRRLRMERGMSLEQAANEIGITKQYLSMVENGHRKSVSFDIMTNIARCYQIPLDYLSNFSETDGPVTPLSEKELELWSIINNQVKEEVYFKKGNSIKSLFQFFQGNGKK